MQSRRASRTPILNHQVAPTRRLWLEKMAAAERLFFCQRPARATEDPRQDVAPWHRLVALSIIASSASTANTCPTSPWPAFAPTAVRFCRRGTPRAADSSAQTPSRRVTLLRDE